MVELIGGIHRVKDASIQGRRALLCGPPSHEVLLLRAQLEAWGLDVSEAARAGNAMARLARPPRPAVVIVTGPASDPLPPRVLRLAAARQVPGVWVDAHPPAGDYHTATWPLDPVALYEWICRQQAAEPSAAPRNALPETPLAERHPLNILVAEDHVPNRRVALRILGRLGYEADVAVNGREAVDAVCSQPYDLVLMDIQMPEMDGIEATREIMARLEDGRRPRIYALTAHPQSAYRATCTEVGMAGFLRKPLQLDALIDVMERCPSQRAAI